MNRPILKSRLCQQLCAAILSLLCGASVIAEELAIEEVIVTARKVAEDLQEVPISISSFDSADIEDFGFRSLEDLDTTVPNFKLNKGQGYGSDTSLNIRGVTSREAAAGFEPTIGVILDDVYIGRSMAFNTALLDIERIEVLRGPQGTLQGRNVVGGAINLTTSRPGDTFESKFKASYERFNTYQLTAYISGPLSETVSGKLAVSFGDGDGYGENVDIDHDLGGRENVSARAQLVFTPSDNLELVLSADYVKDELTPTGLDTDPDYTLTSPSALLEDRNFGGDFLNSTDKEIDGISLNAYYDLANGMQLVSISSYRGFEFDALLDQDNASNVLLGGGFVVHSLIEREQDQFSQELRLHSSKDGALTWLVGAYYFTEDLDTGSLSSFGPFLPGLGMIGAFNEVDANISTDSYAVFASLNYDVSDRLTLNGGLRYDINKRKLKSAESSHFDGVLPGPVPTPFVNFGAGSNTVPSSFAISTPFPATGASIEDKEVTGDLSLTYHWNDNISTYAKYSRGFKGGGFNALFSFGQAGGTVEPEYVDAWEVGFRSYLMDRRVRLNATFFQLDYTDQQVLDFAIGPGGITFITTNEPETESSGLELEVKALITDGLEATFTLGVLDAEFNGGANDGNTPTDSPDLTYSAVLQYTRPINSSMSFFAMVDATYSDEYFTVVENSPISLQDDYWMYNARIGIQHPDGKWSLRAYGKNLSDEDVQTTSFNVPGVYSLLSLTNPRLYGIEFTYYIN